jgi:hypothetical protein
MGRVALAVGCRLPTLRNETPRLRWNVSLATRDLARGLAMPKERKTVDQLSDMIVSAMGSKGVYPCLQRLCYSWQPTVISSLGDSIGFQRRVDEIANRLRFQFDMQECRHAPNTVPLIILPCL